MKTDIWFLKENKTTDLPLNPNTPHVTHVSWSVASNTSWSISHINWPSLMAINSLIKDTLTFSPSVILQHHLAKVKLIHSWLELYIFYTVFKFSQKTEKGFIYMYSTTTKILWAWAVMSFTEWAWARLRKTDTLWAIKRQNSMEKQLSLAQTRLLSLTQSHWVT